MVASAVFGIGYGLLSERLPGLPAPVLGALWRRIVCREHRRYCALTWDNDGERNAPAPLRAERLGLHILYGMLAALIAERLNKR